MGWLYQSGLFVTLLFLTVSVGAQTLVDEAKAPLEASPEGAVFNETIKIISSTRRIFVLTNNNQQLEKGDFISLALNDNLAARALVAKTHDGQAGIKILKIYSMAQWNQLHKNREVQIIRGDDSRFGKKAAEEKAVATTEEAPKIKDEDDLFNNKVIVEDELAILDGNEKRHIKPDNLVGISMGFMTAEDIDGGTQRATQLAAGWAYQFADNWFVEGVYARAQLEDFPGQGAQTLVNNVIGRIKFNFKAPLYCYVMPYAGFRSQTVSSNAGETGDVVTDDRELEEVDKLKKTGPVFGVTLLRRLVPGWFIRADLGTDVMNVGATIEF